MTTALLGMGLVFVIEGLVLALAPMRLKRVLVLLTALPRDRLRALGLFSLAGGVGLVWLAQSLA